MVDLIKILRQVEKAVLKASKIVLKKDYAVMQKDSQINLVTQVDIDVQNALVIALKKILPDAGFIGEENHLEENDKEYCWVIDPIDGTINFANNLPLWGIQVACIKNDEPCAAVILLPEYNELYYADENGAFLNGEKIHVNNLPANLSLYDFLGKDSTDCFQKMQRHNPHFRHTYCAAITYSWIACGKLGGATCIINNPWDYIPGQYIVKQAGGYIIDRPNAHTSANSEQLAKLLDSCIID